MAKFGGKQEGAGRPKGTLSRPRISVIEHFTQKEVKEFFDDLKLRAKTDSRIALYLAEQMTGKAPQAMSIDMGGSLVLQFDQSFNGISNPTPEATTDSEV